MNELKPKRPCPECGLELPSGAESFACPACSLRLALSPAAAETSAPDSPPPPGLKSRFFGDYEILNEIARGGMGVVYRARQLGLNRLVALKMIQSHHLLSDEARLRFRVEIEAVARLDHPHIVSLYDSGEHEGAHFFTMRLVEGGTLAERISNRKSQIANRVDVALLVKVCRAVHYAHQRGILHRDLKPSNILVDAQGEPHVADFGLAKSLDHDTGFTFTSSVLGSPNYMAPEQAASKGRQLTTAVDVYGLGAILYHLLAGRPPFQAKTPLETLRQVVEEEPVAPSRITNDDLRFTTPQTNLLVNRKSKFVNPVDRDLETIALKCLRKEPTARYGSAEELAQDLERWLEGHPILARPLGPLAVAWRWMRRRPAVAALCAVSALAVLVLTIGSNVMARRLQVAAEGTARLVKRLQHEKAGGLLDMGETSTGLALLAHLLEQEPEDAAVGMRLMSTLAQRSFAVPWPRPWASRGEVFALGFATNGLHSFAIAENGHFRFVDLRTRETSEGSLVKSSESLVSAALHPDGLRLATAHPNGDVRIWEIAARPGLVATLPHEGPVQRIVFDPGSPGIATIDAGNKLRLWKPAADATQQWSFTEFTSPSGGKALTCVFNRTGTQLAVGRDSGRVEVWSTWNASSVRRHLFAGQPMVMEFDASGRRLAVATDRRRAFVWSLDNSNADLAEFDFLVKATDFDFSPDGRFLALAGWSHQGEAYVWDLDSGQRIAEPLRHRSHLTTVRFSPDGSQLVTLGHDSTARCWSTSSWRPTREPMMHQSSVRHVAFNSDGTLLLTGSYSGAVWWDLARPPGYPQALTHDAKVTRGLFAPDGTTLVTATARGKVNVWSRSDGSVQHSYQAHLSAVSLLEMSPAGRWIAAGDTSGNVHLWDVTRRETTGVIRNPAPVRSMEFSPTNPWIVTAGVDGMARVWDCFRRELAVPPMTHGAPLLGARYSPDGRLLATFGVNNEVRVWDAHTGVSRLGPFRGNDSTTHVQFTRDNRQLVTGGGEDRTTLWDLATGRKTEFPSLEKPGTIPWAFNPAGTLLVTASRNDMVEIVRLNFREQAPTVIAHPAPVSAVQFTADGQWLFTVTQRGEARLWDPQSGLPVTDSMRMEPAGTSACLSPDGTGVLTFGDSVEAGLWTLPRYDPAHASRLIQAAESIGRRKVLPSGQIGMTRITDGSVDPLRIELSALLFPSLGTSSPGARPGPQPSR